MRHNLLAHGSQPNLGELVLVSDYGVWDAGDAEDECDDDAGAVFAGAAVDDKGGVRAVAEVEEDGTVGGTGGVEDVAVGLGEALEKRRRVFSEMALSGLGWTLGYESTQRELEGSLPRLCRSDMQHTVTR